MAPKYPKPVHPTIIEPFAGSAGYSLRYHDRSVVLVEADPVIASVWRYLLRSTPREVLALPDIEVGQDVKSLDVEPGAAALIGFWLTRGGEGPRRILSAWGREPRYASQFWGPAVRDRIARQVEAIRHWTLIEGDYSTAPDMKATWFVDPPYIVAGKRYRCQPDSFESLAAWCRNRLGQTMVCENSGAKWLPFEHFLDAKASNLRPSRVSREALWLSSEVTAGVVD